MQLRKVLFCLVVVSSLAATIAPGAALADDPNTHAAELFKEGERAFESGDFGRAARLFEEAHALRPHLSALWNAARSRHRAGDLVQAANLYVQYIALSPPSAERAIAEDAVAKFRTTLAEIALRPAPPNGSRITIDAAPIAGTSAFVAPGEHVVEAMIEGTAVHETVRAAAGAQTVVVLARPPSPPLAETRAALREPPRPPAAPEERHGSGLTPIVFFGGVALTVGLGAVAVWSGLDTLDQRDAYEASLSRAAYDDGIAKERRTNILLAATVGAFVLTGVAALFTRWHAPVSGRGERVSVQW